MHEGLAEATARPSRKRRRDRDESSAEHPLTVTPRSMAATGAYEGAVSARAVYCALLLLAGVNSAESSTIAPSCGGEQRWSEPRPAIDRGERAYGEFLEALRDRAELVVVGHNTFAWNVRGARPIVHFSGGMIWGDRIRTLSSPLAGVKLESPRIGKGANGEIQLLFPRAQRLASGRVVNSLWRSRLAGGMWLPPDSIDSPWEPDWSQTSVTSMVTTKHGLFVASTGRHYGELLTYRTRGRTWIVDRLSLPNEPLYIVAAQQRDTIAVFIVTPTSGSSNAASSLLAVRSADGGVTWSGIERVYDGGIAGMYLPRIGVIGSRLVLVFAEGADTSRRRLTFLESSDVGRTWLLKAAVRAPTAFEGFSAWFGDGAAHVLTLEREAERIRYYRFCDGGVVERPSPARRGVHTWPSIFGDGAGVVAAWGEAVAGDLGNLPTLFYSRLERRVLR